MESASCGFREEATFAAAVLGVCTRKQKIHVLVARIKGARATRLSAVAHLDPQ